ARILCPAPVIGWLNAGAAGLHTAGNAVMRLMDVQRTACASAAGPSHVARLAREAHAGGSEAGRLTRSGGATCQREACLPLLDAVRYVVWRLVVSPSVYVSRPLACGPTGSAGRMGRSLPVLRMALPRRARLMTLGARTTELVRGAPLTPRT